MGNDEEDAPPIVRQACRNCYGPINEKDRMCLKCGQALAEDRDFDQDQKDQYDFLVACAYGDGDRIKWCNGVRYRLGEDPEGLDNSGQLDIIDWNQGRWVSLSPQESPDTDLAQIQLETAYLRGAWLRDADLRGAGLEQANLQGANLHAASCQEATFERARMNGACLQSGQFQGIKLWGTCLEEANLVYCHLERANLDRANMSGTEARHTYLSGATHMAKTDQTPNDNDDDDDDDKKSPDQVSEQACACIGENDARKEETNGKDDGEKKLDTNTDFRGAGLRTANIEPELRGQLQYNARRLEWFEWYDNHPVLQLLVRPFWCFSDYGRSTMKIVLWLIALSFLFALLYSCSGRSLIRGLTKTVETNQIVPHDVVPFRAFYFSVVTMTTLGFGDLTAQPGSQAGHLILTFQVFLGYVLLGGLITRFAIMFEGGVGPVEKPPLGPKATWWERGEDTVCRMFGCIWEKVEHFTSDLTKYLGGHEGGTSRC